MFLVLLYMLYVISMLDQITRGWEEMFEREILLNDDRILIFGSVVPFMDSRVNLKCPSVHHVVLLLL